MIIESLLPLWIVLASFACGIIIFMLPEDGVRVRTTINLAGVIAMILLVALLLVGVSDGNRLQFEYAFAGDLVFSLRSDKLSVLFLSLSAVLWLLTTIYAIGYLEKDRGRSRFFGFFSLCVSATAGVSMAGNLLTLLLFYEALTLAT